jgi:hypothetical protein
VKAVHDEPRAKWLPARYRFALGRLAALLMLRAAPAKSRGGPEHLALVVDRDQNAIEAYVLSLVWTATVSSYIAVVLPLLLPVALLVAVPLSAIAMPLLCMLSTLALRDTDHTSLNSIWLLSLLTLFSVYFAMQPSWVRLVAWAFLALVALNLLAAAALWLVRERVRALEARCGV